LLSGRLAKEAERSILLSTHEMELAMQVDDNLRLMLFRRGMRNTGTIAGTGRFRAVFSEQPLFSRSP
jgi:ABC-type multidrug transport system ATPase subunit